MTPTWDPATATYTDPVSGEHWIYADPRSFDNPAAQQPVYTSGPQPTPEMLRTDGTGLADGNAPGERRPEPGELGLVGRRAWKTWQLVLAVVAAALFGMWFNGSTGTASGNTSTAKAGYALPAAAGSSTPAAGAQSTATSTAAAGASTTTTTAPAAAGAAGTPSTTVATGPATILIPSTQLAGNWTSTAFTIASGTWNIGWAFQCTPAPAATPTFEIFAVPAGTAPTASSTPAVTSAAASGQSVTPQTTAGSQQIVIQTSNACRWAVKVTGYSG